MILAKNNGKAVSDIIGIDDKYTAFCVDETASYIYGKLIEKPEPTIKKGNKFMQTLAIWKGKK